MKLSVVISAYNEEKMIEDCLSSVKDLADEIIFVDNSSTDKTPQIAKKYTDKIFTRVNDPVMLNRNKNYGFSKAAGDWILSLDADERLIPELSAEIRIRDTKFPEKISFLANGLSIQSGGRIIIFAFSKKVKENSRKNTSTRK